MSLCDIMASSSEYIRHNTTSYGRESAPNRQLKDAVGSSKMIKVEFSARVGVHCWRRLFTQLFILALRPIPHSTAMRPRGRRAPMVGAAQGLFPDRQRPPAQIEAALRRDYVGADSILPATLLLCCLGRIFSLRLCISYYDKTTLISAKMHVILTGAAGTGKKQKADLIKFGSRPRNAGAKSRTRFSRVICRFGLWMVARGYLSGLRYQGGFSTDLSCY
jgi:hypothetical protein